MARPRPEMEQTVMKAQGKSGKTRLIVATGFGNFLESFDFTVYSYFATIIGFSILKTDDPLLSTYISTILFGLGFPARPIGSVILGAYADRRGRKAALFITIMLMGAGSALIAFTPPYAVIGLAAPALIVLGRLLQGFSAGGEMGSAAALLLESAQATKRGTYIAWQFMMQGMSAAVGALFAFCLFSTLSEPAMRAWGWRIPFIFALAIIPVGFYIRAHIAESWRGDKAENDTALHPVRLIGQHYLGRFLLAVITVMPVTLLVYIVIIYMPTYLSLIALKAGGAAGLQGNSRYVLTIIMSLVMMAATFCGGLICNKIARRKIFAVICLSAAFCGCFITYFYAATDFALFIGGLLLSTIMLGMMMTVQALLVMEAFPRNVRVTGFGFSLALGSVLFGSTAQAIVTKLMMVTGAAKLTPFYYLGPMLLLAIAAYAAFPEEHYP
ncbi:MFS transporter [Candidatus Tokpelaia sp.]|nr:MFS transporter [Candidatus Tokpelaia sp.]